MYRGDSIIQIFSMLFILLLVSGCKGQTIKEGQGDKEHTKLIKTPGNSNLQCSLLDKTGNLWFGTSDDGLFKYDGHSFTQFSVIHGLSSNSISSLLEDKDGKIWIGTETGLCLYDPLANGSSHQENSNGKRNKIFTPIQIPLPPDLKPNQNSYYRNSHRVYSIIQAKNGWLWLATMDGVFYYDGQKFTHFLIDEAPNGFLTNNDKVEKIFEDKEGKLWFGGRTNQGVFQYDGKTIKHFQLPEFTLQFESKKVNHSWAWPQCQDKDGNIWFSNWGGAYRYDGNTFMGFSKKEGLPGYNGLVTKIIVDKKGKLWLGGDGGLSHYDGKTFTGYKNGLVNSWIWTILEDKSGNLWVGTRDTGLYLFDGKTFIKYDENKR